MERSLIINVFHRIFEVMVEPKLKTRRPLKAQAPETVTPGPRGTKLDAPHNGRRPTIANLRAQARKALREKEGIDFGQLSRAQRDEMLLKHFGV